MVKERWLSVVGYEGLYQISNRGRVWSENVQRCLSLQYDKDGYTRICLYKECKRKMFRVHRLVATAFIPNPRKHHEVHHKNRCRDDNCVENLEWRTLHHGVEGDDGLCIGVTELATGREYLFYSFDDAAAFSGIPAKVIQADVLGQPCPSVLIQKYKFKDLTF